MNPVDLARLEFALVAGLHFIFVVVTLGTVPVVAIMNTAWALTRKPVYERLTRYIGQIYVINYAVGIVSGLVMEFQLGLNWNGLSLVTGNVFGIPLALETLLAFFAESTFLGLWIFGWRILNRWVHLALIWLVVITAFLSAFSIMVANGFMHNPVGFRMQGTQAVLTNFGALVGNPSAVLAFIHIFGASALVGGFLIAGIAAYFFLKRSPDFELYQIMMRTGILMVTIGGPFVVVAGFWQFSVARPDWFKPTDTAIMGILLAFMIAFGFFTTLLTWVMMLPLLIRTVISRVRPILYLMVAMTPLPILVTLMGWYYREESRQPWAVVGVLRVDHAMSGLSPGWLAIMTIAFVTILVALLVVDYVLILRTIRRGPDAAQLGSFAGPPPAPAAVPAPTGY